MHFILLLHVFSSDWPYTSPHLKPKTKMFYTTFSQTAPRVNSGGSQKKFRWRQYLPPSRSHVSIFRWVPFIGYISGPEAFRGQTSRETMLRAYILEVPWSTFDRNKISQSFPVNAYRSTTTTPHPPNNFRFIINKSSHYLTLDNLRYRNDLKQTINKRKIKHASKLLTSEIYGSQFLLRS